MLLFLATAHATTCAYFSTAWPPDGTTDLPQNMQFIVDLGYADEEFDLLDASGARVPVTTSPALRTTGWHAYLVRPIEPLEYGTYQVYTDHVFGGLLATYEVSQPIDTKPPDPAFLVGQQRDWWGNGELLTLDAPADAAAIRVRGWRPNNAFGPEIQRFGASGSLLIGPGLCAPGNTRYIEPAGGELFEIAIEVFDAAGNASEPTSFQFITSEDPNYNPTPDPDPVDTDTPVEPEPEEPTPPRPPDDVTADDPAPIPRSGSYHSECGGCRSGEGRRWTLGFLSRRR